MTVSLVRSNLDGAADGVLSALELLGYKPTGAPVFIKPNLPDYAPPGMGLFTEPAVVEGLLRYFAGRPIVIGEGAIVGRSAMKAFQRTGYADLAGRYGAQLLDLNDVPRVEFQWEFGTLRLPALLLTHEYVNVAKMKTHIQTGVTLGMKNQKGLLTPSDKKRFHKLGLNECIAALARAVRPALTVVDGTIALEGLGPWRFGTPVDMGVIVAGTDVEEVDNVCLDLMGFGHSDAPHIPPMEQVSTVGVQPHEVRRVFRMDYPGYFQYRKVYEHISDSCSGCNIALYRAIRSLQRSRLGKVRLLLNGQMRRTDIFLGSGDELPREHGRVLCIGDCARPLAQTHGFRLVRGCPPDPDDIARRF